MAARAYIRHPSDMPIELSPLEAHEQVCTLTKDISIGGLSFYSRRPFDTGTEVNVKIPVTTPPFEANVKVVWCVSNVDGYDVGVEFIHSSDAYKARMVEQVCHIEHYRLWVKEVEGRELDSERAAKEWIGKFAGQFPALV